MGIMSVNEYIRALSVVPSTVYTHKVVTIIFIFFFCGESLLPKLVPKSH